MQKSKSKSQKYRTTVFILGVVFGLLTTYYLLLTTVYAANEFSPAYDVTYEVKETGKTVVTQNVHLTNLATNYYATEYTLTYGTDKIDQIEAWDGAGPLKLDVTKGTDLTQIHVAFNEKVVGIGKTMNWTLRFMSPEIAQRVGRIWEINIPRISPEEQTTAYNINLVVPAGFGSPAYVYPVPTKLYYWTLPASRQGITLAFGDWQGFKFNLTYHLENPGLMPGKIDIALPPDTAYQKIALEEILPPPTKIFVDKDGNWLASYSFLPKQTQDIKVKGLAQVFLSPRDDFPQADSARVYQDYLKPQQYWEDNAEIKKIASQLKTPPAIYDYVTKTLTYDYGRAAEEKSPVRLGAQGVLAQPNRAICMEFTDLFIALSRAAGIPAREVDGFAYTSNSKLRPLSLITDILHAWPEYWDDQKNTWVQVDPTWGKTSLLNYFRRFDFDHLAFVVRGLSSTRPYPAGAYKSKNGGKNVLVDFSPDFPATMTSPLEVQFEFPKIIIAGLPLNGQLKISNRNRVALYHLRIDLASSRLAPKNQTENLTVIPPLTQVALGVELENANLLAYGKNTLSARIGPKPVSVNSQIIPLPLIILPATLGLFLLVFWLVRFFKKIWMDLFKKV